MRLITIAICLFLAACGGANDADLFSGSSSSTVPEARDGTVTEAPEASDGSLEPSNADGHGKLMRPQKPAQNPDAGSEPEGSKPDAGPDAEDPWSWVDDWETYPEIEYAECLADVDQEERRGACLVPGECYGDRCLPEDGTRIYARTGCADPSAQCVPCFLWDRDWSGACEGLGPPEPVHEECNVAFCPQGQNGIKACAPDGSCTMDCYHGYELDPINGVSCVPVQ